MSSQRQKKRNAQFKKKRHEFKPREDSSSSVKTGETGRPSVKPAESKDRSHDSNPVPSKTPPSPNTATVQPGAHREKQYSKRKVVSNWDRYSEEGLDGGGVAPEGEKELEQRLVQLLNLPTAAPTLSGTLPRSEECQPPPPSFLSLDCEALAASLSSLPLHQKLDISWEIFALAEDTTTEGDALSNSPRLDRPSHEPASPTPSDNHTKQPLTLEQFTFDFPSPETFKQQTVDAPLTQARTSGHRHLANMPSANEPHTTHGTTLITGDPSPSHPGTTTALVGDIQGAPTAGESTSELDDILDELLA